MYKKGKSLTESNLVYIRPSSSGKKKKAYLTAFVSTYLIPHGPFKNRPLSRVIETTATHITAFSPLR